jgi:YidC/Oxa1 family membrane protein insertase
VIGEQRNLVLAIILSGAILLGWNYLFVVPQQQALQEEQARQAAEQGESAAVSDQPQLGAELPAAGSESLGISPAESREQALGASRRVAIDSDRLTGSIALTGGRIDDLALRDYRETVDPESTNIELLMPTGTELPYYVQTGWLTQDNTFLGHDVEWRTDSDRLAPGRPVTLTWDSGEGLIFERTIALDDDYMFTVTQRVRNTGAADVTLRPYSLASRTGTPDILGFYILHEGLLGVLDGTLEEIDYDDLEPGAPIRQETTGGWLGITDKYWLVALIPDQEQAVQTSFSTGRTNGLEKYQTDFLAPPVTVPAGGSAEVTSHVFAGAKEVTLLDQYEKDLGIVNFDLAVDFGWFYFLTKPIFYVLHWLDGALGNFGLAILALTMIFRGILFPLNNRAYRSMSKMKLLAPKIQELKERYGDDRMRFGQEQMAMFKREKVNPAAGCLPMIPTIIIFFSLYKVLFVSIEMRHAPFYGWIHDLSAPDPLGILTLFGLVSWNVPEMLELVNIGIWPLLMGSTMYLQQKLSPTPPDPTQAKIMMMLPFVFTFILAKFPAGLVIYWTWSNILTIGQQWIIKRGVERDYPDLSGKKPKPKPREEEARDAPGGDATPEASAEEPATESDSGSEPKPTGEDRHAKARGKRAKGQHGRRRR